MIGPDRLKCHVYSSGGHGTLTVEQAQQPIYED